MKPIHLNDIHSQLNETIVARYFKPNTVAELQRIIVDAKQAGQSISISGGRHAMGGQQFAANSWHIDVTGLQRVLQCDSNKGLITVEAGIMWPKLIEATHRMPHPAGLTWAIKQKQTGVDDVTLSGSISACAHGRGLLLAPISDDIESLTLLNADAALVHCSRTENAELFSLVVGGYGLFGVIVSATLRLMQRQKLERVVDVIDLEDAANAIYRRIEDGALYGDFQYAIDHTGDRFMQRGVFACYKPAAETSSEPSAESDLPSDSWLKLLALAHTDKNRAFKIYAGHYLQTDGESYWSDTMQLSTYIPSYVDFLAKMQPEQQTKESLIIGEHYVPPDQLIHFMNAAREVLVKHKVEVIYGTIRLIQPDTTAYLAWAKERYCCVIFNLRTPHTEEGRANTQRCFQALTDESTRLGGSFFLTYHRAASAAQVEKCYPNIKNFLVFKKQYDPTSLFQSEWWRHYSRLLNT